MKDATSNLTPWPIDCAPAGCPAASASGCMPRTEPPAEIQRSANCIVSVGLHDTCAARYRAPAEGPVVSTPGGRTRCRPRCRCGHDGRLPAPPRCSFAPARREGLLAPCSISATGSGASWAVATGACDLPARHACIAAHPQCHSRLDIDSRLYIGTTPDPSTMMAMLHAPAGLRGAKHGIPLLQARCAAVWTDAAGFLHRVHWSEPAGVRGLCGCPSTRCRAMAATSTRRCTPLFSNIVKTNEELL